jgi:hypothetical protein
MISGIANRDSPYIIQAQPEDDDKKINKPHAALSEIRNFCSLVISRTRDRKVIPTESQRFVTRTRAGKEFIPWKSADLAKALSMGSHREGMSLSSQKTRGCAYV